MKNKEYYNRIIALLGFKYIPLSLVQFFCRVAIWFEKGAPCRTDENIY